MPDDHQVQERWLSSAQLLAERLKDANWKAAHATQTGKHWSEPVTIYMGADGEIRVAVVKYGPREIKLRKDLTPD